MTPPATTTAQPTATPHKVVRIFAPLPVLASLTLLLFAVSLSIGPAGFGLPANSDAARLVFWEIRVPRAVLGFLIGSALGLSGAVLQGFLRNPLAEPALLGVSGGASLGAVLAIHSGLAASFSLALPLGGLIGAAIATLAVIALAGSGAGSLALILSGVAIASVTSALTSLALNLAPNPFASVEILFWLMGSLNDRSLTHVWIAAPLIISGCALLLMTGRQLDALTLGEDSARNLGVDLTRLRRIIVIGTAMAVGAATSVTGAIGFIGLVVPHLLRPLFGYEPRRLLPASGLGGAALLLAADIALRILSPAGDLRLGVVTSLIGAPFFLWLVLKTRREMAP